MASISNKTSAEKAKRGLTHRSVRTGEIYGRALHPDVRGESYFFYQGKGQPLLFLADLSAVAAGTVNVRCVAVLPGGQHLYFTPHTGAVTTAPYGPTASTLGLDISLDQTATEGVNYEFGSDTGPFVLTVERTAGGTVPKGMFIRAKLLVPDVSGVTDLAIGFRKVEAVQADLDNYDELACLNLQAGDVKIETILNGGATVTVDTLANWADNEIHELLVGVTGKGTVTFQIDGDDCPVSRAFQFDDNEVVIPFIYHVNGTDLSEVHVKELEVGFLDQLEG